MPPSKPRRKPSAPRSQGPTMDALLLRAQCHALTEALAGAQVQKIHEPEPGALVLRLHPTPGGLPLIVRCKGRGLLALAENLDENPPEPSAFCMLLRKYLAGGRVVGLEADGLDRVAALRVRSKMGETRLVLELFGARTNLHLVGEDQRLLGSRHRYPADRERLAERTYRPPPPAPGCDPPPPPPGPTAAGEALAASLDDPHPARALRKALPALPPRHAELALAEAAVDPDRAAALVRGVLAPPSGEGPFLRVRFQGRDLALVGAPEDLEAEGAHVEAFPDLDALVRAVFVAGARRSRAERDRTACRRALGRLRAQLERKLEKNQQGLARCARVDELAAQGELLKTNLHAVKPGQSSVTLTDWSSGEAREVEVPLDPKRNARQNLDNLFDKVKRLRLKAPILERKRQHLEADQAELDDLEARLADPEADPALLRQDLRDRGLLDETTRPSPKAKRVKDKRPKLRTFVSSDGLRILIGRNGRENDYLLRKAAGKKDTWLHAQGVAGAHVVIKVGDQGKVPATTREEAALLAAHFSKSRFQTKAAIMVARVADLKKVPGAPAGEVTVRHHDTLVVRPDPEVVRRLAPLGKG